MISREDIKEGLKFRLPSNTLKRKRQVEGFGNIPEFREPTQHLTTLKTPGGDKRYITPEVPLFEVCGGPKLISSADKNDPHCAWVGEYIKVRSVALGKKPLYISLNDVMQHGVYVKGSDYLRYIFSMENSKNDWTYNFICGGSRSGGKKYCMEHYGCSLIDALAKSSVFTEQPTGDADAFRDITDGMYDTFKAKNSDYGNSFSELFAECGMTYAYGHLSEKLKRVKSLMSDEAKVKDESMRDSLLDLANYAVLTIMELDKKKSND